MRGVVLAGGLGTRLGDLTKVTNKHLLPVFDKPMIYYPINTLVKAGITEIMVIVSGPHSGAFLPILKNGNQFGISQLRYAFQEGADSGISDALALAKDFAQNESIAVILGDNVSDFQIGKTVQNFSQGCHIFLKKVEDPQNFGVVRFSSKKHHSLDNSGSSIIEIIEKPKNPPSNSAVTGIYLFDNKVFDYIAKCKPSKRNQLEITDVLNQYIENKSLSFSYLNGYWHDSGTPNSLFEASEYWYNKHQFEKLTIFSRGATQYTNEAIDFWLRWKNLSIIRCSNYTKSNVPMKWKCAIDGYEWEMRSSDLMRRLGEKIPCKNCSQKLRVVQNNVFIDSSLNDRNIKRIDSCNLMKDKIAFNCLICNCCWKAQATDVVLGSGCPKCKHKNQAKVEDIIRKLFERDYEITTQKTIEIKPDFLKKKPSVDFYLSNSRTTIIVEYNGKQHYHPVCFGNISKETAMSNLTKQQKRDNWLREYCNFNSIKLIELPYTLSMIDIERKLMEEIYE